MGGLAGTQAIMDAGRRLAANKVGQTFDVYRLNATSTGSLVQPSNLVISGYRAFIGREEKQIETEANVIVKVPRFVFTSDSSVLQLGDVLVERGDAFRAEENKPYDGNMFTFAYFRPLKRLVMFQTPIYGQLSRARNNPNGIDSGLVAYGAMSKPLEQYLTLNNGFYSWAPYGSSLTPTVIPMGIIALRSKGELPPPPDRLPTDVKRQTWDVVHFLLPGVTIVESYIYTGASGDRYFVQTPFVGYVGLVAQQNVAEKLRV